MKNSFTLFFALLFSMFSLTAQISTIPSNWNVPYVEEFANQMPGINGNGYSFLDINGDGFTDLIDAKDNSVNSIWTNGAQRYWKVYLNDGSAISTIPSNWNVPYVTALADDMFTVSGAGYSLVDINGDGYPDLVDAADNANTGSIWTNGAQRYWKVYLNDGNAISTVPTNWNVPYLTAQASDMGNTSGAGYSLVDINGDGYPDLVDTEDNDNPGIVWTNGAQRYWKVYLNDGNAISTVPTTWNVPYVKSLASDMSSVSGIGYSFIDINGDSKPDLVDAEDNTNSSHTWTTGAQRYWKVYLNDGNAISTIPTNWNVPYVKEHAYQMGSVSGSGYSLVDINGDSKPDLVDSEDNNNAGSVWTTGAQRYWKVYLNDGAAISTIPSNWNVPYLKTHANEMSGVNSVGYNLIDINGDSKPDLIDSEDNDNLGEVWTNGAQRYWKVYLNEYDPEGPSGIDNSLEQLQLTLYPNPTNNELQLNFETAISNAIVRIFNITGNVVFEEAEFTGKYLKLNVLKFSSGVYFIEINTENEFSRIKFVKK